MFEAGGTFTETKEEVERLRFRVKARGQRSAGHFKSPPNVPCQRYIGTLEGADNVEPTKICSFVFILPS